MRQYFAQNNVAGNVQHKDLLEGRCLRGTRLQLTILIEIVKHISKVAISLIAIRSESEAEARAAEFDFEPFKGAPATKDKLQPAMDLCVLQ